MSKIAVAVFAIVFTACVATMAAASSWGADNLPHKIHNMAWHIVALR